MHKSFIISEEDRNRILGMHESATKRQYLSEQTAPAKAPNMVTKTTAPTPETLIVTAVSGPGTNEENLLKGFQLIKNFDATEKNLVKNSDFGYKSVEDMLKGEMENDSVSTEFLKKLQPILSKLGVKLNFNFEKNDNGLVKDSIKISKYIAQTQNWAPELENCVKSSGGKKDVQGVYWFKSTNGSKIGYYSDGRYHEEGGKTWGKYFCQGNKISYYSYDDVKSTTPKIDTKTTTPGGTASPTYKIPPQLLNKEGVTKFQTWMEANHKGWYVGNKPIDGNFGKQTNAAWVKYGSEYMLKNPQNFGPLAPKPEPTFPSLPQ